MIRVLQVVTSMERGGLETMLMNYYRNIDREQVQFDFLVHRQERAAYDDEIESLGGKIYRLPNLNPIGRTYLKALRQFFKMHTEYRVVHAHLNCLSSVVLKEAKKAGVPARIAHSHSTAQEKDLKYPIKMICMRSIPKYATQLLACSEEAGKWLFRGEAFQVIPNAINASVYTYSLKKRREIRERLRIPENTVVIGHIGRFEPPKNHAFLLDIFKQLLKAIDAKLLLVGDGPLKRNIETKAGELGIKDKVLFTGVRSDISDLLQAMDTFVLPSIREGLPVTIVEAQAAGLPCLISDKVPIECKITDLVQQIPLSESVKTWAEAAIKAAQTERRDTSGEIRTAEYDVTTSAENLRRIYYGCLKPHEMCPLQRKRKEVQVKSGDR